MLNGCSSPTLHLNQELSLDSAGRFAFVLVPGAAQRVHLVDEDDGGLVLAGQFKQVPHQSAWQGVREGKAMKASLEHCTPSDSFRPFDYPT